MTPGLKRSLAARAAARSSGRLSSPHPISRRAASREIGAPRRKGATVVIEVKATVESNDTTAERGNVGGCRNTRNDVACYVFAGGATNDGERRCKRQRFSDAYDLESFRIPQSHGMLRHG